MHTSSNYMRRGNMGTRHPSKEQASRCKNIYRKEYSKYHISGQKNKHLGKRKDKCHRHDGTSPKTEVDLGRARQQEIRLVRRWRDELDDYWMVTIWQRIAQDRHAWKQHAEAFAQPRDSMAAQW